MKNNFKKGLLILPLAIVFLSNIALAEMQGNPANGAALYKSCVPCHTEKGKGITGLSEDSLMNTMTTYQKGKYTNRKQIGMQNSLKSLNKQELMDLASYITKM